ncbi:MAG: homoserine dehydrogenase [Lachnospiraceae bacterium]|nr:homoserine dehydrogenase [Lachnospiraceae bacterium]
MIKVAIFGFGTVGSGVAEVLDVNRAEIMKRTGMDIEVKYILDLRDFPGHKFESKVVHDVDIILNDPEVAICCETMGGKTFAYDYTKRALAAGKSVCSSNKELVEAYGPELIELAKAHECSYLFEASEGGGIPIIRNINQCLTADKIESIMGILNGTTNYMLTKMDREGADYAEVLKEAQDMGYAEQNPAADVEGHDAGRKIAILASLACGKTVPYQSLYVEGITCITSMDFKYAAKLGMSIKLIGQCRIEGEQVFAMVSPCLIKNTHPLYMVNDVFNGVLVHGNMLGDALFYGAGAGKLPTASAVCADVIALAGSLGEHIPCKWAQEQAILAPHEAQKHTFFVRMKQTGRDEAVSLFGATEYIELEGQSEECAFVTAEMTEQDFAQRYAKLSGAISRIRMA